MAQVQIRRWCFTANNYDNLVEDAIQIFAVTHCKYLTYGREVAPGTGTPHLQGFFILKRSQRFNWVQSHFPQAHLAGARADSSTAAAYCHKEDANPYIYGEITKQGANWAGFRAWVSNLTEKPTERDLFEEFPNLFGQYRKSLNYIVDMYFPPDPLVDVERVELRDWQRQLADRINGEADDRTIYFYVDEQGAAGKSFFTQYCFSSNDSTQVFSIGKRDDIAHSVDPTKRVFIFDIPRGGMEYLQYNVLEMLKNRLVYSPKYDSKTKVLQFKPHVIVFSNEEPDQTKLTNDRFDITFISDTPFE